MDERIKLEFKAQIVAACRLAVNKAAALCPSLSEFVAEITTESAMSLSNSLTLLRNRKRGLQGAEEHLLRAAEKLYGLDRLQSWVRENDYIEILMLCEHGVAGLLDKENERTDPRWEGYDGPRQTEIQGYIHSAVLPLIQAAFVFMRAAQKEERRLEKLKSK